MGQPKGLTGVDVVRPFQLIPSNSQWPWVNWNHTVGLLDDMLGQQYIEPMLSDAVYQRYVTYCSEESSSGVKAGIDNVPVGGRQVNNEMFPVWSILRM